MPVTKLTDEPALADPPDEDSSRRLLETGSS